MIYLIAAAACSTGNSLIIKFAENKTGNRLSLLLVNYIAAVLLGMAFIVAEPGGSGSALSLQNVTAALNTADGKVLLMGLVNGALYVTSFILLQKNILVNGATVSASLSHMGLLIPILLSIVVFHEMPAGLQIAGTVFALAAIVLISVPQKSDVMGNGAGDPRSQTSVDGAAADSRPMGGAGSRLLLIPMLLSSGTADMMSKLFEAYCDHAAEDVFMQITFTVALVLCLMGCLKRHEKMSRYDVIYGSALGVFNYMSVKFLIWALYGHEAFLIYILYGIGVVLVMNVINVLLMHETLSRRDYAGMGLIIAAIVFLNL